MKIAILGFGEQGRSAFEYWNKPEHELTICDSNDDLAVPDGADSRLGADHLKGLSEFDILIRTPVLHPQKILGANPEAPDILKKVWSNTNEFFKVCPTKNIIGVTGTKGKGTTSALIAHILKTAGKTAHLGGNIGIPPLDLLKNNIQPDDWVVLELANFQLIDLKFSPHIAVCLMVVPEHLDWHKDMDEYILAKQQLFRWQTVHDKTIYNFNSAHSREVVSTSAGKKIPYDVPGPGAEPHQRKGGYLLGGALYVDEQKICDTSDVALLGRHNLENACAGFTATWDIVRDAAPLKKAVQTFAGLPHRLELVREVNGVKYYDDSFGTTPESAIVAIQAFEQPKVIILGGSDKGASYDALAHVVTAHNVRAAVLIGDTAAAIGDALKRAGFTSSYDGGDTMESIVNTAWKHAKPGDIVLLSTGCASFGLFKNYYDRGDQFKKAVAAI